MLRRAGGRLVMRTKEIAWIASACFISSIIAAQVFYSIPKEPKYVPTEPPIVQTEEQTIVEEHRTLEHNKHAPQQAQTADEYLCEVYHRTPIKKDRGGDFTWKDKAAAKRLDMDICTYAIGGMAPELKTRLVTFGKAADAQGLQWSIFSAFRDDYRQSIASGIKARTGNSRHGNSRATRGYGDGRAIDIAAVGPIKPILALIDKIGRDLGLTRPHKGFDPNHVQLASKFVTSHRVAKVKVAKTKVRYAKRIRHRTKVAVRNYDRDYSYRPDTEHSSARAKQRGKVSRLRSA